MKWPVCISHAGPSQGETLSQKPAPFRRFCHTGDIAASGKGRMAQNRFLSDSAQRQMQAASNTARV
ncbi:hypothetical protein OCAR_5671 [Afipia carboxidovorans OM5]|nr:hypothetical protein OCAR_5671 [Afipia carboxidovorans OM5]